MKKIKISKLESLEIGEELVVENDMFEYAFTIVEILGMDYIAFGVNGLGGNLAIMPTIELNESGYKKLENEINSKFDVNIEFVFDVDKYITAM